MTKYEIYARDLANAQGLEQALKIVTDCLTIASRSDEVYFYDEVDWTLNTKTMSLMPVRNNSRSSKTNGKRTRRITNNKNFYNEVLIALKKLG